MTVQNIRRLAALVAKNFGQIPAFDYSQYRERQAEGNAYRFGTFVLILRDQSLGLAQLPEAFKFIDGYELRLGRKILRRVPDLREIHEPCLFYDEQKEQSRVNFPSGKSIGELELMERQRRFAVEAAEEGFSLGRKFRELIRLEVSAQGAWGVREFPASEFTSEAGAELRRKAA